jgi:hypothetical protein
MDAALGLFIILFFWVAPVAAGIAIGRSKNRAGWAWGLFLGWLGIIILVVLSPKRPMTLEELERKRSKDVISQRYYDDKKAELLASRTHRECPHCKEQMRRNASVCPHCQRDSQAWTENEGYWWKPDENGSWLYLDELTGEWHSPTVAPAS